MREKHRSVWLHPDHWGSGLQPRGSVCPSWCAGRPGEGSRSSDFSHLGFCMNSADQQSPIEFVEGLATNKNEQPLLTHLLLLDHLRGPGAGPRDGKVRGFKLAGRRRRRRFRPRGPAGLALFQTAAQAP